MVKRDDVWLVALDPTLGSELRKTRPAVIVSPDVTNKHLNTVVVVPLTSSIHTFAFRPEFDFDDRRAQAAVDQVRVIDKQRLVSKLGLLNPSASRLVLDGLRQYFS